MFVFVLFRFIRRFPVLFFCLFYTVNSCIMSIHSQCQIITWSFHLDGGLFYFKIILIGLIFARQIFASFRPFSKRLYRKNKSVWFCFHFIYFFRSANDIKNYIEKLISHSNVKSSIMLTSFYCLFRMDTIDVCMWTWKLWMSKDLI